MTQDDERRHAVRMAWTGDEIEIEGDSEIPWGYNDPPDPDPIAAGAGGPQVEQFASTITGQLELAVAGDGEGILGQLIELAGNEAWRHERRGPGGRWTGGSPAVRANPNMSVGITRVAQRHAVQNRQAAEQAVAAKVALEQARAEVERVTAQLKAEQRTESNIAHRVKLALHALVWIAAGLAAALMAKYDVSPVIAGFASSIPVLGVELIDWKKKL